ncbi:hypothetical protein BC940DRAFT_348649 [Gongronella butleri]|nr:hypothetical protein BC940DRAFT_348649 [Gongronella butleri]
MQTPRPTSRPAFKEKFVEYTEAILKGTAPFGRDPSTFWDTYFLLSVNSRCIHDCVQATTAEALLTRSKDLNELFSVCVKAMSVSDVTPLDQTRQVNATIILTCLVRALFLKRRLTTFNIIGLLTGLDNANESFANLIQTIDNLLQRQLTKPHALNLALTLAAGNDNVSQNSLNGYFIQRDLSPTLLHILTDDLSSPEERRKALIMFSLLANYNKYESRNPYLHQLSQWRQQSVLDEILCIYSQIMLEMTRKYQALKDEDESIAKSVANYMTSWFSGSTGAPPVDIDSAETLAQFPPCEAAWLLMLYDLINTNPAFVQRIVRTFQGQPDADAEAQQAAQFVPCLLSFMSYLVQHNRNERSSIYTKLTLLILLRLCEEQAFLATLTQAGSEQQIHLCRQRLPPLSRPKKPEMLVCAILDDMLLFLKHNLRKKLDMALYRLALAIMHRVLAFLFKRHIRLDYHWYEVWPTLTSVLHFVIVNLDTLKSRSDELTPFLSILITLYNISLTHGETFLHDTKSFDTLFYDIIRSSDDVMALSQYLSLHSMVKSGDRSPTLTVNSLSNLKMVCHHFKPALDEWQQAQNVKYPSPEQVMALIQRHFDTLSLAPMDKLDHFTPYNEIPHEMPFFRFLLRIVVNDYWHTGDKNSLAMAAKATSRGNEA